MSISKHLLWLPKKREPEQAPQEHIAEQSKLKVYKFDAYHFEDVPKFLCLIANSGARFISASVNSGGAFNCESGYIIVYSHTEELMMEALC